MKKWKMMALICVLCCSLSGCGLSFCGIPLGKREPLTFVCGEKNVEMQADEEADGGKLSEQDSTEVQMTMHRRQSGMGPLLRIHLSRQHSQIPCTPMEKSTSTPPGWRN